MLFVRSTSFVAALVLIAAVSWPVSAEVNRVLFPEGYEQGVHYTSVTRGDVLEEMFTSQEALDAARNGEPIPDGTKVTLVISRDGAITRYFVMEKGDGWGDDYDEYRRTADWQFQSFAADRTVDMAENTERCQSCHRPRASTEFMFTFNDMVNHK